MWLPLALLIALSAPTVKLSPDQEMAARELETQVIAPCCWSQQVSVHQSPAADEMRQDIRRRLARGETRQQILDDYVVQFGERILVEPPAKGYKLLLYVFPPVALVVSAFGIVAIVKRATKRRPDDEPLASTAPGSTATNRANADYADRLEDELRDMD